MWIDSYKLFFVILIPIRALEKWVIVLNESSTRRLKAAGGICPSLGVDDVLVTEEIFC